VRSRFTLAALRAERPDFIATHLIALDGAQHRDGPWTSSAYQTLEALDALIGELVAAARANDPRTIVAIVSDHGFVATHSAVSLRSTFVAAGLIELERPLETHAAPRIAAWHAQVWPAGGAAAIVLRDRDDRELRERVAKLLAELASDSRNGIARVLTRDELVTRGAFPEADFAVEFAPGFYAGAALVGELVTPGTSKGTHGYLPERPEMHAAFFAKGGGISAGQDLGVVDMRQIAPTLARWLGVDLPSARAEALPVRR
jgi:predicted AlkP superfamily pyrophosphatase or phosphodiesterase